MIQNSEFKIKNLVIIADDLGLHKSVNDGIIFLLKNKKIDGASLMVNGEAFEDAVKQCLDANLSSIGIHLNLVEQKSVVSGELMAKNHRIFFLKHLFGLFKKNYIRRELNAQIEKIIQAGIRPSFINGNQHLHLLPGIIDIVIDLAKKYEIPYIRIVNESLGLSRDNLLRQAQLSFLNFLSKLARNKVKKAGLECNDYFVGFINAGKIEEGDILKAEELARKYPNKVIELGCHPGYESEELKIRYSHWGDYNWQKELEILENLRP